MFKASKGPTACANMTLEEKIMHTKLNYTGNTWITLDEAKQLARTWGPFDCLVPVWPIKDRPRYLTHPYLTCKECGHPVGPGDKFMGRHRCFVAGGITERKLKSNLSHCSTGMILFLIDEVVIGAQ
jgi:hypothetical protein